MSKLTRVLQRLFASTSGSTQIGVFGSLAAGSPQYAGSDALAVQALPNFEAGWPGAVVGGNSPAIEDLNALCYLYGYQLAYLFQQGIPEYDGSTVYYFASVFQSGGSFYQVTYGSASGVSGQAPPNTTYYKSFILDGSPTLFISSDSGSNAIGPGSVTVVLSGSLAALNNNPIEISIIPTLGSAKFSLISTTTLGPSAINTEMLVYLYRNGTQIAQMSTRQRVLGAPTTVIDDLVHETPVSAFRWIDDSPGSSVNLYEVGFQPFDAGGAVNDVRLMIKQVNT